MCLENVQRGWEVWEVWVVSEVVSEVVSVRIGVALFICTPL